MAFMDENGLAELWSLVRNADMKIATGSYTGTGKTGSSNPNILTFGFKPKYVQVISHSVSDCRDALFFVSGNSVVWYEWQGSSGKSIIPQGENFGASVTNDGIKWWTYANGTVQLNNSGVVFDYIAIG